MAAYMTIPGPGPEAHRVAVKRCVTNTGAGVGDQGGLVTPNFWALIGLGASWRAQLIEKHQKKTDGGADHGGDAPRALFSLRRCDVT